MSNSTLEKRVFHNTTLLTGKFPAATLTSSILQRLQQIIEDCGGTLLQDSADEIIVAFGIPHELPAVTFLAVHAAAEIQQLFAAGNTRPVIGLYQGGVILRDWQGQYQVMGNVAIMAQHLLKRANPGEIMIPSSIMEEVRLMMTYLGLGEIPEPNTMGFPVEFYRLRVLEPHPSIVPQKILITEDNPDLRHIFTKVLKHAGFQVRVAQNGQEAIQHLQADLPNVLVLDLEMPEVSGVDVMRFLSDFDAKKQVHTIIVTGNHRASEHPEMSKADLFMVKPISTRDLVHLVKRLVAV